MPDSARSNTIEADGPVSSTTSGAISGPDSDTVADTTSGAAAGAPAITWPYSCRKRNREARSRDRVSYLSSSQTPDWQRVEHPREDPREALSRGFSADRAQCYHIGRCNSRGRSVLDSGVKAPGTTGKMILCNGGSPCWAPRRLLYPVQSSLTPRPSAKLCASALSSAS